MRNKKYISSALRKIIIQKEFAAQRVRARTGRGAEVRWCIDRSKYFA